MSHCLLSVDITFHDTILVNTNSRENIQNILVAGIDTVENKGNDDLLPSRSALIPKLGLLQVDNIANVLHHTVQSTSGERLILVVVSNRNEELSMTVVHGWAQVVTIVKCEFIGIASSRGICVRTKDSVSLPFRLPPSWLSSWNTGLVSRTSHVGKLLASSLQVVTVLGLDRILDRTRDRVIDTQDGALHQLDLTSGVSAQPTISTTRCLSLAPGLGR